MEGVAMPIVSIFGLFGNVVSCIILYNRHGSWNKNSSFTNLLICLAMFDSLFLVLANYLYAVPKIFPVQPNFHNLCIPYLVPFTNIFLTGSVYTVVAITVERYATLRQCRSRVFTARVLVILIIIFAVCYNFIKFFELTTEQVKVEEDGVDTYTYIELKPTWLRTHPLYSIGYIVVINFLVMSLTPLVVLGVLNFLIYKSLSKITQNQNSDSTMAALLFSIVIVFLCCHSPRLILNIYEGFQMLCYGTIRYWPEALDTLTKLNHLLLAINSSVNIVIYTAKDLKFRHALFLMFRCKKGSMETETLSMNKMSEEMTKDDAISQTVH